VGLKKQMRINGFWTLCFGRVQADLLLFRDSADHLRFVLLVSSVPFFTIATGNFDSVGLFTFFTVNLDDKEAMSLFRH